MKTTTVSAPGWCVGWTSGDGIDGVLFHPFRVVGQKHHHPACYGRTFPDSRSAGEFALEHGYTRRFYGRPDGFIQLRLSPRTREFLRSRPRALFWYYLPLLLGARAESEYFRSVRRNTYMASTRERWERAVFGRGGEREERAVPAPRRKRLTPA